MQASDARFEEEIATGEERGFVHGNTGWEPVNRLGPRLIAKIQALINKCVQQAELTQQLAER